MKFIVTLILIMLTPSCNSATAHATRVANSVDVFADKAHAVLTEEQKADYEGCVSLATKEAVLECGSGVQKKYATAWVSYRVMRRTWLSLSASIQAARASQSSPADLGIALVKLTQAADDLKTAIEEFEK